MFGVFRSVFRLRFFKVFRDNFVFLYACIAAAGVACYEWLRILLKIVVLQSSHRDLQCRSVVSNGFPVQESLRQYVYTGLKGEHHLLNDVEILVEVDSSLSSSVVPLKRSDALA